jgi:hypothetical protein
MGYSPRLMHARREARGLPGRRRGDVVGALLVVFGDMAEARTAGCDGAADHSGGLRARWHGEHWLSALGARFGRGSGSPAVTSSGSTKTRQMATKTRLRWLVSVCRTRRRQSTIDVRFLPSSGTAHSRRHCPLADVDRGELSARAARPYGSVSFGTISVLIRDPPAVVVGDARQCLWRQCCARLVRDRDSSGRDGVPELAVASARRHDVPPVRFKSDRALNWTNG